MSNTDVSSKEFGELAYRDADVLRELYHGKGLDQAEVAEVLGCSIPTVGKWMQKNGIDTRSGGCTKTGEWDTPETFRELYHERGLSLREIASELGVSDTLVYRRMDEYGIGRRTKSEATREKIAALNIDDDGYEGWFGGSKGGFLRVHQLLAISEGADPHKIFSNGEWHVHHKNGVKWDNRPGNIEVIRGDEHPDKHDLQHSLSSEEKRELAKERRRNPDGTFAPASADPGE